MFFGWRVVAGAFISMMLVTGFYTYAFTLLVTPLREEFGASLEQVMYAMTLATLAGLVMGPIAGILIDRVDVRRLMTFGCLVVAAGFYILAQVESITAFNLVYAVALSIGNALASSMAGSAAVSRWFQRSRGRALGIATIGTSVGGVLVPALTTYWIGESGWRGALENMALFTALVVTPLVWINVRGRPEDIGLRPEGASEEEAPAAMPPGHAGMGMGEIVKQRDFWTISLSVGFFVAVFSSMMANLSPYATQLGATEVQASSLIMSLAIAGLIGKLAFGMAADRISLKWGMWAAHALVGGAFVIMAFEPAYGFIMVAAVLLGLATGGLLPVWNAMMANVFGVDSFGRAMGAMGPIITLLIMPAYAITGRLYDSSGSYVTALWYFCAVLVLAAALLVPLRLHSSSH